MDSTMAPWEKRALYRSLTILIKSLENELVTVDLRNETSVSGRIVHVDSVMNVTMDDAAFVEYAGEYKYFESLFIPCRMIRNVVIPDHMPITRNILSMIPTGHKKQVVEKKLKKTFKMKRALKNQQETLKLLKEAQEKKTEACSSKTSVI